MKHKIATSQSSVGGEGIITTTLCRPETKEAWDAYNRLRSTRLRMQAMEEQGAYDKDTLGLKRIMRRLEKAYHEKAMLKQRVQKNIVTKDGTTQITKALSDNLNSLDKLKINETAVGDDDTTPQTSDSQLANETYRNTVNSLDFTDNIFFASMFIDFNEDSGTYEEAGLFIDGDGSTNSGTLFDRALIEQPDGVSKTTSETLTISFQVTFTSV